MMVASVIVEIMSKVIDRRLGKRFTAALTSASEIFGLPAKSSTSRVSLIARQQAALVIARWKKSRRWKHHGARTRVHRSV